VKRGEGGVCERGEGGVCERGEVGVCGREDSKNLAQGMINSPNVRSKQGEAKAVKDYEVVWASWPNVGIHEK
jgi:hypothetical protein